jgi:hypothetical protein
MGISSSIGYCNLQTGQMRESSRAISFPIHLGHTSTCNSSLKSAIFPVPPLFIKILNPFIRGLSIKNQKSKKDFWETGREASALESKRDYRLFLPFDLLALPKQ